MTQESQLGFETRLLHSGRSSAPSAGPAAGAAPRPPSPGLEDDELTQGGELEPYGNPTRLSAAATADFEQRLAALEGAAGAVAVASGRAAQFATFMTLLRPGDELVAASRRHGGAVSQLSNALKKLDITTRFVDPSDLASWEAAITPRTRAFHGELVDDLSGRILDLERVAELASSFGIPLIVDSTLATPYLCRPIEHGASIVIHSSSRFLGGHGSGAGGVVLERGRLEPPNVPGVAAPAPSSPRLGAVAALGRHAFLTKLRTETVRDVGARLSPGDARRLLQGLATLSLRLERQVGTALAVARFLAEHRKVAWVGYAGLPDHPDHQLASKYTPRGPGAAFAFGLRTGGELREAGRRFLAHLQLFSPVADVGTVRSIALHPASTTHLHLANDELQACGLRPELIRLSVGLETAADLLWDLDRALAAV